MNKRIQIPLSLYENMIGYIQDHFDKNDQTRFYEILKGIEAKREAEIRRNLYTAYKSEVEPVTREMLRNSYLDKAGVPSHGRWDEDTEVKLRKGNFDF